MHSASLLKLTIERALEHRFPAALTVQPRLLRETAATGLQNLDRLLGGGLPVGAISELTGPDSSGRTSIAFAFMAQCTAYGQVCAWVDAADSLDPDSAAASGIDLERLLWIRCGYVERRSQAAPVWTRMDQVLRAADLLLQVGGFGAIVLDLGNTSPEQGSRIPLATWYRWRQAAERTRCSLVVLGKMPYAQSSAAMVVECAPSHAVSIGQRVLQRFEFHAECRRERMTQFTTGKRKLPAAAWSAPATWDTEKRA
jgi:recombination protein RecA